MPIIRIELNNGNKGFMSPKLPANLPITLVRATRAETDEAQCRSATEDRRFHKADERAS